MKEYVTMKEAALLIDKTPKTIKNYIKRGRITNFFLVDGKYGQEYQISVKDLEPLGILYPEVLEGDFSVRGRKAGKDDLISGENGLSQLDGTMIMKRYEEIILELGQCRERLDAMTEENRKLKQEVEEKNMLIHVLMKKENP